MELPFRVVSQRQTPPNFERAGGPGLNLGCPIFARSHRAKVGLRGKLEPWKGTMTSRTTNISPSRRISLAKRAEVSEVPGEELSVGGDVVVRDKLKDVPEIC